MRNVFRAIIVALILAIAAPVAAQDYEAGRQAYVRGDYAAALRELRPLAEQGDADAQAFLGIMYDIGDGVPQDYAEAVKWYRMAAEQGLAEAQFFLGFMYRFGKGVPQDFVLAHMWSNLAASKGKEAATKAREILAGEMTPEQIAEAQKLAREWKPSKGTDDGD